MAKVLFPIELNKHNVYLRDDLINKFKQYVDLPKSRILELGIGNGRFGFLLGSYVAKYYGIDIDEEYVKIAKTNIPKGANIVYKVGSAENIPFDEKFDIVFYAQSWHFIKDFDRALKEATRVLKTKGIVAILEPSQNSSGWADPRLNKDSPEFNENLFKKKMADLKKGRDAILKQKLFDIIEDETLETKQQFYVLKIKVSK